MSKFSIVIVCKNEAHIIAHTLQTMQDVTDDVVVYDNGSTDSTLSIAQQFSNVRIVQGPWEGFGPTKHKATLQAKYNWVLSLDADEALDAHLQKALKTIDLQNPNVIYRLTFKTFLGHKELKWGEWRGDHHLRLYNRQLVNWNLARVHESLVVPAGVTEQKLNGHILHYTVKDLADYSTKMTTYALLNAEKYYHKGKKASLVKRYFSGPFAFFKSYFLLLGFLDGWEGLVCARIISYYTTLKYARLHELQSLQKTN